MNYHYAHTQSWFFYRSVWDVFCANLAYAARAYFWQGVLDFHGSNNVITRIEDFRILHIFIMNYSWFRVLSPGIWGLNSTTRGAWRFTEWIWPKLAEKQAYESLRPLRSKSRKCSVRFYVVAITRFPNFPNSQLPGQQRTENGGQMPCWPEYKVREFEKSCNGDYAKSNATLSRFRS